MDGKRVALYAVVALAVIVGFYFMYLLLDVLILIFVAILFATAIGPLVDRLRSLIGIGKAVLTVYVAIAIVFGVIGYLVFRAVLEQTATLATNLPQLIASLQGTVHAIEVPFLRQMLDDVLMQLAALVVTEPSVSSGVAQGVLSVTTSIVTIAFGFFTVLVMAYYWTEERPAILQLFVSLFPEDQRAVASAVWERIEEKLGGWVRGELILMGIVGGMAAIGYSALGVKYALLLAVFAGLTELIPIVGPWIGSVPAVLVALTQSFWLAVAVAVYAALIQTFENNIFVPRVMGSSTGISPLLVIVALLAGLKLMGIAGALLAVPVASALQVIVQALVLEPVAARRKLTPPPT